MSLPFTVDQFFGVFREYNETVWPMQWLLALLALMAIVASIRGGRAASSVVSGVLAALWVWMGAVYHIGFFAGINPIARVFGLLFIVQGALFAWVGVARGGLPFERRFDMTTVIGFAFVVYALIVYPAIGSALGHQYPASPTFGVPCPTTIFTFGMILISATPHPRTLILIPVAWAAVSVSAAVQLGVWEDLGLVAAALVTALIVLLHRRVERRGAVAFAGP